MFLNEKNTPGFIEMNAAVALQDALMSLDTSKRNKR
jgi:hypothetical protein